jgi:hypothetical protein
MTGLIVKLLQVGAIAGLPAQLATIILSVLILMQSLYSWAFIEACKTARVIPISDGSYVQVFGP